MASRRDHPLQFDFGKATTYTPDLRAHEMVARVLWFIKMRWIAVLACAFGSIAAFESLVPASLDPRYFGITALFLTVSNLVYTAVNRTVFAESKRPHGLKRLLLSQMFFDFSALSFLTYACGSIETPLPTLFMAHIILATVFFNRAHALVIMAAAWFFATLPLVLEWLGAVPVISIFDGRIKAQVAASTTITGGFVIATGATFFVCWYLVSEISRSLKLRELQLEDAYRMLVRMDKEKTQATLRATHELKAPFAAIKSYVYTLRDGYCGELPDKAKAVVGRIGDRCDHLTRKITDIIHLSNLQTLLISDMDLKPVDLTALLKEEAEEGALLGKPRGITVNPPDETEPVYVQGSKAHLRTLVSNLIQNAVFYSRKDEGVVSLSVHHPPNRVSVIVSDNGIGIPGENLDKIFDEHFRSKNAVAHHADGTGLGLSLVKEIARLHGATVSVESTVGKGTAFTVSFDPLGTEPERENHGAHTHH